MYSLAVFPRQVPIPTDWLDTKNITDAFHHCDCYCTPPSGSTRDPVMTTWFHGICPYRYPYGLYNSTQNILLADLEDPELLHCLQSESYLGLFSFLSDLEWYVYNEFNTFLKYPIVMFYFKRYTKSFTSGIDVRAKVFGMGHGIVPIEASTTLGEIHTFQNDPDIKDTWMKQLFFSIRCALKNDYFDKFLTIHAYLDTFKTF